ncbi:MAG TPA: pyridoxamine 5'-phosphate oxidase family protein [Myxococcota bacterium]|nr:pyridoxamine 5'-phosphate oxidase family protein [Myxococcota bacterium]
METTHYPASARTEVRRLPERGSLERALVHAILDEGLVCHVGLATPEGPVVIPTLYARDGERLYLHGSPASRLLRTLSRGAPVCITVTLVDGLVLARSAFHHSMNYRSAVLFGRAREVEEIEEKRRALGILVEHVIPGRTPDTRPPNDFEERYTRVLAFEIEQASAKVRSGGPKDDEADLALGHWAGEIPLRLVPGAPVPDPVLAPGVAPPPYAVRYERPRR